MGKCGKPASPVRDERVSVGSRNVKRSFRFVCTRYAEQNHQVLES